MNKIDNDGLNSGEVDGVSDTAESANVMVIRAWIEADLLRER